MKTDWGAPIIFFLIINLSILILVHLCKGARGDEFFGGLEIN